MESAGLMLGPHPEEPRSGVSKDGNAVLSPSFETREERAPQDEVSLLFDRRNLNQVSRVSSPLRKNIPVHFRSKSLLYPPPSRPTHKGRFAIVTNVGRGRDGRERR